MKNYILNVIDCIIIAIVLWFAVLAPAISLADDLNARSLSHARYLFEVERATEEYDSSVTYHLLSLPNVVDATPSWPDHCGND